MSLVKAIACQVKSKLPAHIELDDLVQAGMIGLIDAISKYQKDSAQFSTYAAQRIRGSIIDELRAADWLPRSARKLAKEIDQTINRLEQSLQRTPRGEEIAAKLGVNLETYHASIYSVHKAQIGHDEWITEDDSIVFYEIDQTTSRPLDGSDQLMANQFSQGLNHAIQNLPEREKYFMSMYYERDLNLKEIAQLLEVTEARASQIHSQAIIRLRHALKEML
jgi:RNA polymerase sigma factor for flagellar operon FliA